ncbi:MAG: 3-deoxy-D-manno-octulosonic acid transferase [Prevotellaceae bacterium]|jgi:3-deoxy-D-manno-octulosonic-acid transferase|nr:3-deoxy-D-manno-octulosonic acid transferase [Prevotellaceae bacterium]
MYSILLFITYGLLWLASPFSKKIRAWLTMRNGTIKTLAASLSKENQPIVWLHCASLGEFEQGRPILEAFLQRHPQYKALITLYSTSGYEQVKKYHSAHYLALLPLDTCFNARRFVKTVKPQMTLWIRYEFWSNHLKELKRNDYPCYLISATFRKRQIFFYPWGWFFRAILRCFNHIFVQNEASQELLAKINIASTVTGDTRFDRVIEIAARSKDYPTVAQFAEGGKTLIAGSSWPSDERVLAEVMREFPDVKLIMVPHEIDEAHIAEIEQRFTYRRTIRYTEAEGKDMKQYDLMIINTIGMLSSIYRYAQVAYIGCGFDDGIHNISEAAVYGIPVVFAPNYHKFEEANDLVAMKGALVIRNAEELIAVIRSLYTDENRRQLLGKICKDYIFANSGTSEKSLNKIDAESNYSHNEPKAESRRQ